MKKSMKRHLLKFSLVAPTFLWAMVVNDLYTCTHEKNLWVDSWSFLACCPVVYVSACCYSLSTKICHYANICDIPYLLGTSNWKGGGSHFHTCRFCMPFLRFTSLVNQSMPCLQVFIKTAGWIRLLQGRSGGCTNASTIGHYITCSNVDLMLLWMNTAQCHLLQIYFTTITGNTKYA